MDIRTDHIIKNYHLVDGKQNSKEIKLEELVSTVTEQLGVNLLTNLMEQLD